MSEDVLVEKRDDGIAKITLNRPDSLNAMGGQLMPMLAQALAEASTDRKVRCVVLTGAGRAFCAGGDVKGMAAGRDALGDNGASSASSAAVGAGLSLALACDIRIASEQAKLGTVFRNVGFSGDFGGSYFLQRLVGVGKARELYFTGEILTADAAGNIGMVNRVVPHDRLEPETMALAGQLASGPTLAYARMKENLNRGEFCDLGTLLDQEALNMRLSGMTNDHREAAKAFVEKRQPTFSGN